jgi:probable F420-dependent oxidoreductase
MTAASAEVEIGLGLPGLDDVAGSARWAEQAGFDYLFSGEHLFFHVPVPNAFVALAAAAGATSRIKLLSGVTVLPLYPAVVAAKMASVLDRVSAGRFHLGVGVGGEFPREFEAAGVPLAERGRRTNETLEVMRLLFSDERASFEGTWTRFDDVGLDPMPLTPGGPPIWIAGRSEAAIRRAGRFGDVWMPYMYTPEQVAESLASVRAHAAEHDRDPDAVGAAIYAFVNVDEDGDRARAAIAAAVGRNYDQDFSRLGHYLIAGTPDECAARIREYAAAGATSVQLQPGCAPAEERRVLDLLAGTVLPALRSG